MGVPTIATNVGGLPDIVHPGETGWLVPPRNPGQLASTILEALANPAQGRSMAARGQTLVRDLLDARNTTRQVSEIYGAIGEQRREIVTGVAR